jgi:hypothetical protein
MISFKKVTKTGWNNSSINRMRETALDLAYPFYTRISAISRIAKAMPNPVLVYQMAKVGSSTVHKTLQAAGVESLHVHYIAQENWKRGAKMYVESGTTLPAHFHKGRLLRHWIAWTGRQVRVISLVRDPIARHISASFETAHLKGFPKQNASKALRSLESQLMSDGALEHPYNWFDREISSVLGVDVLDYPFNREEGYGVIEKKNAKIIILTLENLSDSIPTVLSDFLGKELDIKKERVRKSGVYERVKKNLSIPKSRARKLYDHPWMRNFYTEEKIENFVKEWGE